MVRGSPFRATSSRRISPSMPDSWSKANVDSRVTEQQQLMKRRILTVVVAACAAIIVYSCVRGLEALFVHVVAPPKGEMRSVNYVMLSAAFGVAMYLWLDLRTTRATLT